MHDEGITEFRKRQRWLRLGFSDICRGRGTVVTLGHGRGEMETVPTVEIYLGEEVRF